MKTLIDAIISLSDGKAQVAIKDENIDNIEWLNGTTPIAKEDILAEQSRLQEEEDANPSTEELKASAKTKLMAGEPLTEEEADVMIGG